MNPEGGGDRNEQKKKGYFCGHCGGCDCDSRSSMRIFQAQRKLTAGNVPVSAAGILENWNDGEYVGGCGRKTETGRPQNQGFHREKRYPSVRPVENVRWKIELFCMNMRQGVGRQSPWAHGNQFYSLPVLRLQLTKTEEKQYT